MITSVAFLAAAPRSAASLTSVVPLASPMPQTASPDLGWTSPTILVPHVPTNANLGGVALAGDRTGMVVFEKDGLWAQIYATRYVPGAGYGGTNWQTPVNLSSPGCNGYSPKVAMNATGYAMVVWEDTCGYGIRASLFHPGVGWSTPVVIDAGGTYSYIPQVAMNAAGVTFVTWYSWYGSGYAPYANRYVPGTGWGTPMRIDPTTNWSYGPSVGVDAQGNAIVSWYRSDAGVNHVYASRYGSGMWSVPTRLASSANASYYPSVSVDTEGNGVVAWLERDSLYRIWANRFDNATGLWTGAVPIESQPEWAVYWQGPQVSASNGSAVVVWTMFGPGSEPYSVFANRFTAGAWGTEADVDFTYGTTSYADNPSVFLDPQGNATISFDSVNPVQGGQNPAWLMTIRYSALTGGVSLIYLHNYQTLGQGAPLTAGNPAGDAFVAWNYNEGTATNPINGILALPYTIAGGWSYSQQAEWDEYVAPHWLQLESNAAGDAIFSWTQNNGLLSGATGDGYAAIYTPGSGWGTPVKIENFDSSGATEEWSAIDGQGNAMVLFRASNGTQYNVYAIYYSIRTGWGKVVRIDTAAGSSKYWLRIMLNRNGNGVACWTEYNGISTNAYTAFFNGTTQTWSAPAAVQSEFSTVYSVVVGIDAQGNAAAAFEAYNGSGYANYGSYYQPGVGWGAPTLLNKHSAYIADIPYYMAQNDQGDFAVSWREWTGSHYSAVASEFTPQGGWSTDSYVTNGPYDSYQSTPSVDGAGDMMLTYQMWDGQHNDVFAVLRPPGGSWGTPALLNTGSAEAEQATSAMSYRGDAYAAWSQYNGYGWDVMARRYVAGQGWLPATVLNTPAPATPSTDSGTPLLATDGHGNAIMGWNEWHQGVLVPYAAEYTAGSGAPNLAVASPADGSLTNNATVIISGATDPGATVAINGTGATVAADGSFGRSLLLADGTYTFTIVATNAAGLTQTATRTITVDTTAPPLSLTSPTGGLLTRDPVIQVSGTTEAGATVVVNGVDAAVSSSGAFSVALGLHEGANTITATSTDAAGNRAQSSVSVTLDTTPPAIAITSPASGANVTVPMVTVTGTAEPGSTVTVNGKSVTLDSSGAFSVQLTLSEGANLITATATDPAGNTASAISVVTYTNPQPAAQVQSTLGSLNTMDLVLIVLVIVSLGLGAFEMLQIRKLRAAQGPATPKEKPEAPKPPDDL